MISYNKIVNPKTDKLVRVNSSLGKKILLNFAMKFTQSPILMYSSDQFKMQILSFFLKYEYFSQKRPISPNQLHQNVYCDLKIYFSNQNRALKYMNPIIF